MIQKKLFHKKKENFAKLEHYVPDITITPVDYVLPDYSSIYEHSKKEMLEFLSKTEPDIYCEQYFKNIAYVRAQEMKADLLSQQKKHMEAIRNIVSKHEAERIRLERTIKEKEKILNQHREELELLMKLYTEKNGGYMI